MNKDKLESMFDVLLGVVGPPTDSPVGEPTENTRSRILSEALDLVNGDRERDYGPPSENLARIRDFWNTYLSNVTRSEVNLESRHVADLMILLKIARLVESPTEDSYKDIIGYGAIGAEVAEKS